MIQKLSCSQVTAVALNGTRPTLGQWGAELTTDRGRSRAWRLWTVGGPRHCARHYTSCSTVHTYVHCRPARRCHCLPDRCAHGLAGQQHRTNIIPYGFVPDFQVTCSNAHPPSSAFGFRLMFTYLFMYPSHVHKERKRHSQQTEFQIGFRLSEKRVRRTRQF